MDDVCRAERDFRDRRRARRKITATPWPSDSTPAVSVFAVKTFSVEGRIQGRDAGEKCPLSQGRRKG